jgi:signal transduction histidine kinase
MRERVEGQGGTLTVESAPGRGTAIVAALPAAVQARRGGQAPEVR